MPKREYMLFIKDIRDCTKKIMDYTKGKTYEEFTGNQMLMDAVIRNLEIIGEATKNIPDEVKQKHPQIEWRKIGDLRNIIIHGYFRIDYDILWDIVQNKIPNLAIKIEEVLKMEGKNE